MAGDLRLGRRALSSTPGLLEELREKGAGTNFAQFRMGPKLRHPERYDEKGQLKVTAGVAPAAAAAATDEGQGGVATATKPATKKKGTKKGGQ